MELLVLEDWVCDNVLALLEWKIANGITTENMAKVFCFFAENGIEPKGCIVMDEFIDSDFENEGGN